MENIKVLSTPNMNKGRDGWKPDIIACHITDGNYDGAVSWLQNPISKASAHFVVARDGRIVQLVDIRDTAWCNGTTLKQGDSRFYGNATIKAVRERKTNANSYTVTIEHEGIYNETKGALTDKQQEATTELIKHIITEVKRIYGIDIPIDREHIVGHYQITPKWKPNCPGQKFPFDEILSSLKESLIESSIAANKKNVKINNKVYQIEIVIINGFNYIKLRDLKQAGFNVDYDSDKKMPIIISPVK